MGKQNENWTLAHFDGATAYITPSPDGMPPDWTVTFLPNRQSGHGRHAWTETSATAAIPHELGEVIMWAKRRWEEVALR